MSRRERRRAVERAERALDRERLRWRSCALVIRARFERHRAAWLIGGGFGAGFVAGLLPWRAGANLGRLAISASSLLLRSPLGASLLQSAHRRIARDDDAHRAE